MSEWKTVFATQEGPEETATGPWPGDRFMGVALPSERAKNKFVEVRYKDKIVLAQVRDVGPWCVDDEPYVFGNLIPRAERFKGYKIKTRLIGGETPTDEGRECPVSNGAGIDLFPEVARQLGIGDGENVFVDWRFVDV